MTNITQIKVAKARKINLGNYETSDSFVEITSEVRLSDDPDQVFLDTVNKANEYLDAEIANVLKERLKKK